ncbi:MAG: long-chain-fatty-acid--CoA ligase [Thermoplasmataceae archaeon]|jgi:fatty-acyl-CoA synthase
MNKHDYELTIEKLLISSVRNNPKQIISYKGEQAKSYREFNESVFLMAKGLVKQGLKPGDRVAVLDVDSMSYMLAYFAVPIAGGVIHTVNIRYSPELIFYTMKHANDKFVMIRDEFVPLIEKSLPLFDFVEKWIITSDLEKPSRMLPGSIPFSEIIKEYPGVSLPDLHEDMPATTFYTSGTTGLPKGVIFSHRQIVLHALASGIALSSEPLDFKGNDVVMPLVPMFHVHAWGVPYGCVMRGMKYVLPGRYDFERLPDIMEKEKVTVSLMVPSILYMLISNPKNTEKLKKLHLRIIVGGGALPRGLAEKAGQLGIDTVCGYGMSETAPILTISNFNQDVNHMSPEEKMDFRIKAGIPAPLVDLRVVDKDFKEVPWDSKSIGEIVVRAPWLTEEYINDPEATVKLWKNDWLNTGDLAVVDSFGYISIVDREKDAVKSGGEFIPTIILEDAISTFPGIGEVAVVGRKDEKWGERPVAFISGLKAIDKDAMRNHLMKYVDSGRIAKFWIPDDYILVEQFEKTGTGKIDKKPLRARLSK